MGTPVLEMEHVTGKRRGFRLSDINFSMQSGYIYGLMGKNGAGKSTLLKTIVNENAKYSGTIRVQGEDIRKNHVHVMNHIAFVSEEHPFFEDRTAGQNAQILGLLLESFSMEKFEQAMEKMNLSCGKTYKKMSRGERLKFQLAFAMAYEPVLYLIDEATAGMDPVFRVDFFAMLQQIIKEEKASVLMTSHMESEMELKADYVGIMEEGKLVCFGEALEVLPALAKRGQE